MGKSKFFDDFFENLKFNLEIYRTKNMGEAGAYCFGKNHGSVREEKRREEENGRNLVRLKSRFLNNKRPVAALPGAKNNV